LLVKNHASKENKENEAFGSRLSKKYSLLKELREAFNMNVYTEEQYNSERAKIEKHYA
jgi:hypothetical protein